MLYVKSFAGYSFIHSRSWRAVLKVIRSTCLKEALQHGQVHSDTKKIMHQSDERLCRTHQKWLSYKKENSCYACDFEWQELIKMVTRDWVIRLCTWSHVYASTHCIPFIMDIYSKRVVTIYHGASCSCTDDWKFHPNVEIPEENWNNRVLSLEYTDQTGSTVYK